MNIKDCVHKAIDLGASDIHLVTGLPPCVRVHGEIQILDGDVVTEEECRRMIDGLLNEEQRRVLASDWKLCFSTVFEDAFHMRVSVYTRLGRPEAAIRLRSFELRNLEQLGLPAAVAELTRAANGLVLITGPTGVGKTTTLYSMMDLINREQRSKIITVEDPIEFMHSHKRSMVIQQELGRDARSFHGALMHILRLDPDVICIGEVRDSETVAATLLAAETGHLVIATLHTTSAAQSIERIITALPAENRAGTAVQLANCLRGVVTQALLPSVDKKSRILAYEVMLANTAVKTNIREFKLNMLNDIIQSCGGEGMNSMDMCLRELYQEGKITFDTALSLARDPKFISAGNHKLSRDLA
jgi:twitching motility protein PilT